MTDTQDTPVVAEPTRAEKLKDASRNALGLKPKVASQPSKPAPATPSAKVDAIEAQGAVAPTQKEGETDQRYEQRLAETLRKLAKTEGEAVTHRKRGDDLEREWKPVKDIIAAAKGDPDKLHDLLELAGYTPESVAQLMIDKKLTRRVPKAQLPPEVQARIDALEATAAKLKEREEAEAEASAKSGDMAAITTAIGAADYPYLTALPGSADRVYATLRAQYDRTGETPDLQGELKRANEAIEADVRALLTEGTVKALVADEKIRATLVAALGMGAPATQPESGSPASERKGKRLVADGPRSLSLNVTSEVPARSDDKPTKQEREQRMRNAARGVLGLK